MKFPKGKIIVFDGLDCCFKETNHAYFSEFMKESFPDHEEEIHVTNFPQYGTWHSTMVEGWLNCSNQKDATLDRAYLMGHPEIVNTFYAMDRVGYWHKILSPEEGEALTHFEELKNGHCFIFDRYATTNVLYNPRLRIPTEYDVIWENDTFDIPLADVVFFMRAPSFSIIEDQLKQKEGKDDNEKDLTYLKKVYQAAERVIEYGVFDEYCKFIPIDIAKINDDGTYTLFTREELRDKVREEFIKWNEESN